MRVFSKMSLIALAIVICPKAWPDEALDAAKKDLAAKWNSVNSYSAALEMKLEETRGDTKRTASGEGKVECIKKNGVELSRVEVAMEVAAPGAAADAPKTKQTSLRVFDGTTLFTENSMMGMTRAFKSTKGSGAIVGGGKALFDQIEQNFTLAVRPNEKLGDRMALVIEGAPKPETQQKAKPIRFYFDLESGAVLRTDILDETGKPRVITLVKDVKINPQIGEERFKYTPPAAPAAPAPAAPAPAAAAK
ncbi:MAG: hypothetical protein HZB26_16455 [Candidatus Hydrogenedentes bacterium]|nr:hypothetical protein [Candidatus Hydrogenedentota bacterium]